MKMCWDAVAHCQKLAGAADSGSITIDSHDQVISMSDDAIGTAEAMRKVPQGAFIGFFEAGKLVHAMVATGQGLAAGTKNACLGIGNPIGWEIVDLAGGLTWGGGGCAAPRALAVRARAM